MGRKIRVDQVGGETLIDIGPRKSPGAALFGVAWTVATSVFVWGGCEMAVAPKPLSASIFLVFWALGAAAIITLGYVGILGEFFAHEQLLIRSDTLTIAWHLFFLHHTRTLPISAISRIWLDERRGRRGGITRHIAFSCDGKVISTTSTLTTAEGTKLINGPLQACLMRAPVG